MDKINGELELAKKKKEALDKLFSEGRVSQMTYDSFSDEVSEAIAEIEAKQDAIVERMKAKIDELEQQMKTLEFLLVNSEIRHVSGEIPEDAYSRECNVLSLGLETTRQELNEIKEAISNISGQSMNTPTSTPELHETEEACQGELKPEPEPETEKRLEIVMDTETTTSIETTVEESPTVEEKVEVPVVEEVVEQSEANTESPVEAVEVAEESFRPDEPQSPAEADTQETPVGEETTETQD